MNYVRLVYILAGRGSAEFQCNDSPGRIYRFLKKKTEGKFEFKHFPSAHKSSTYRKKK